MAEVIEVTYNSNLTIKQTLDDTINPGASAANRVVTHNNHNQTISATGASTDHPVTKGLSKKFAMTAGALTLDFRAILGTNNLSVDGNGLKPRFIKLRCPATNANPIVIVPGAVNGLDLFGAAFKLTLTPGQEILAYLKNGAPTIADADKTIDITGTAAQEIEVDIAMG